MEKLWGSKKTIIYNTPDFLASKLKTSRLFREMIRNCKNNTGQRAVTTFSAFTMLKKLKKM
jgi:hypothetical protein